MSDLFSEKAKGWDADDMVRELSSAIGSAILKKVSLHEKMQVMDFGAGTGLICSHVAPFVKKITAVDISEAMLNKLADKPELWDKVEIVCQDIVEKPVNKKFDLIMSAMALHHVKDTHKLIRRFSEHMKPGAVIALADLDKEDGSFHPEEIQGVFHFGFDRDNFQNILEECGFKDIHLTTAHNLTKNGKNYSVFLAVATAGS